MKLKHAILLLSLFISPVAFSRAKVTILSHCYQFRDARIIAQDGSNTFLGKIANKYSSESIFNEYGNYGNKYNSNSIWNTYGTFGNKQNEYSPFYQYSRNPPMIIKDDKVIAYLSVNQQFNSISPNQLKELCFNMY